MKTAFSKTWKSSIQPRKQRKYAYNAPLHIRRKKLAAHLSKDLRTKHKFRSIQIKSGDKVKVVRGQYRGKTGKIERVNAKDCKVFITGIDITKKEGTKVMYPFHPSNLIITELNLDDKKRIEIKKIVEKTVEKKEKPEATKEKPEVKK